MTMMETLQKTQHYTADHLAALARVSVQAVNKRLRNTEYLVGIIQTGGRPTRLYKSEALYLWQPQQTEQHLSCRKNRNDKGKTRTRNAECVAWLTDIAFAEYMTNAQKDVRSACRRALARAVHHIETKQAHFTIDDIKECAENEWLYKKHVSRSDKYFRGPFHTQGWAQKHEAQWRKHDAALKTGHVRYSFWQLAENDLDCGKNKGFARFIMLDDRKADTWTIDEQGNKKMRYGIYAWCTLTGALLWVEPCNEVTTKAYIKAIVNTIYAHGLDTPVFFLENSRAAIAEQVEHVIQTLYTTADKEILSSTAYTMAFRGSNGVYRNCPHIPRDLGKGKGERLFNEIKRGDALMFPESYHGSGLGEAVQLKRKQIPVLGAYTPSPDDYFSSLYGYAYTEHLDMPRDSLKLWAKQHDSEPTYRAMVNYYKPETKKYPSAMQCAYLLYYVVKVHEVKVQELGSLRVTVRGRQLNLRAPELYAYELSKTMLHVCEIPNDDKNYLVFMPIKNALPKLICVAEDYTVTSIEDISYRHKSRVLREDELNRRRSETAAQFSNSGLDQRKMIVERTQSLNELFDVPVTALQLPADEEESYEIINEDEDFTTYTGLNPDLF